MNAIFLAALVACATAAPQHYDLSPYFRPQFGHHSDMTDIGDELNGLFQFSDAMRELQETIDNMVKEVETRQSEKIEGDNYVISKVLVGFDQKDITVQARQGLLKIKATSDQQNYLEYRTLPSIVNVQGEWTYSNDVLKITFPLNKRGAEPAVTTEEPSFQPENHSREEMETKPPTTDSDNPNIDIEVQTNEIPDTKPSENKVEATTYAVNLNDEFEFVPVHYRK